MTDPLDVVAARIARIALSSLVRTAADAVGGHPEVEALNPAILDREKVLGRKLTEQDLGGFELRGAAARRSDVGSFSPYRNRRRACA